jgi:hypothetical protein
MATSTEDCRGLTFTLDADPTKAPWYGEQLKTKFLGWKVLSTGDKAATNAAEAAVTPPAADTQGAAASALQTIAAAASAPAIQAKRPNTIKDKDIYMIVLKQNNMFIRHKIKLNISLLMIR